MLLVVAGPVDAHPDWNPVRPGQQRQHGRGRGSRQRGLHRQVQGKQRALPHVARFGLGEQVRGLDGRRGGPGGPAPPRTCRPGATGQGGHQVQRQAMP